jgi:hypothetical protein
MGNRINTIVSSSLLIDQLQSVEQVIERAMDDPEIPSFCSKLAPAPQLAEMMFYLLDEVEIISLIQTQCQRDVIFVLPIQLDWTWTLIVVVELPFSTLFGEVPET